MDEPGTINPAALNAPNATIAPNLLTQPSPRGIKRSRSAESYGPQGQKAESEEPQSNKRSKPLKQVDSPTQGMSYTTTQQPVQTPQIKTQSLPHTSPSQISPARSTPGSANKPTTLKALPTVRDHTTDQLGPEGDEYLPRETDPDGDNKVSPDGYPLKGRKFRCRTFQVPNRGEKLFMLATECARVLGYRDSYLLFNKNRSLYKIIANQAEKDNLIHQEILPYSYRSRQIAIVTARSMFRQFGSRLVENGRRVRDDYWEAKARKQGFTEEDAAGEKRPGAAKAREAAAAEASHAAMTSLPQGEIIYNNGPGLEGQPPGLGQVSLAPLPMMQLANDDLRPNSYGNVIRPRQEMLGAPYHDRTQPSNPGDVMTQAVSSAEFNKNLAQTRKHRAGYLDDYWRRPHEQPETQPVTEADASTIAPHTLQSPQAVAGMHQGRAPQDHQLSHPGAQMMPQGYPGAYPNAHTPMASPVQAMHRPMPPNQMHHPSTPMAGAQRQPSYGGGYPSTHQQQQQMWQQQTPQQHQQPQPSPLSQSHHASQYAPQHQQQQQQSPMAPPPPQQMPQQQQQQQHPSGMNYAAQMAQMANPAAFATGMGRSMYPQQQQQQQQQQQFGMQQSGAGLQGWPSTAGPGQEWGRYQ